MLIPAIIALVLVVPLLIGFPIFFAYGMWRMRRDDFSAGGMHFKCEPKSLISLIDQAIIIKCLNAYAVGMAATFDLTPSAIKTHFEEVVCTFQKGYLSNQARDNAGLGDHNNDGTKDRVIGLTYSSKVCRVSVLFPEDDNIHSMINGQGKIALNKTALMYEIHNTVIYKFKGYNVVFMENFINPTDPRIQRLLRASEATLQDLKDQRNKLDAAFYQIKF